jgi:hypothetical protein
MMASEAVSVLNKDVFPIMRAAGCVGAQVWRVKARVDPGAPDLLGL